MAGNYGKYIDRSPIICAAGKASGDPEDTVAATLKQYRLVDEIEALKHDAKIWRKEEFVATMPPIGNHQFLGTNTEISPILQPPVLTRYEQLIQDLKDTPYMSYWNAQLGKVRDPVPGLPKGMDPIETCFGVPTERNVTVKELVNPPKSHKQVLEESQVAHELYKKTHNDYNASEQVTRNYKNFNSNRRFGKQTTYDARGKGVACACDWRHPDHCHAKKFQADFLKRDKSQLGKVLAPNNNIECVPKGHTYGDPSKQHFYGVEDLLKDPKVKPCMFKRDFYQWLASLNKIRLLVKARSVELGNIYKRAMNLDASKSGLLPLHVFYQLCSEYYYLTFPKELEHLCVHLKYIYQDQIDYRKFLDLIDINKEPSDIKPIDNIPEASKYYTSTSQAAQCDYLFIDNNQMPAAGTPSIRHDLPRPVPPIGGCKADIEHLGDETSVKAVISPSIYSTYGLNYRDFFLPRSPEVIKRLFEKIGYNFPGDNFQKLWQMGLEQDQTGQVCVDTFKKLLNCQCPPLKLRVDEKQFECDKY
ncbi:unnamed protein product [Ceutorhynchus assimilis]|uniref:EFHB C-terminal EF-hand domain-containing protein n=1 Tax=Ceutorhynchus assimilis TaxID=467358 RepID=A0A9N9MM10_9CUCU|nr:unnamed protein product [Ceutorhynchus assimilis]